MKRRSAIVIAAGALVISTNIFLILHTDSKVSRTSFIPSWFEAKTETLTETIETAGVVTPAEEHPVYFNGEEGGFEQFSVKKGDQVTTGMPLYEFQSTQVNLERQRLENEINQLNREVALIKGQVEQLAYLKTVFAASSTDNSIAVSGDAIPGVDSGTLVDVTVEKEIYDKEEEIRDLEEEIAGYEASLDSLETDNVIDVNSQVNGTVKEINYDLKNPIMTIISDDPKVSGTFLEEDLAVVKEGMEAYITSDLLKDKLPGRLTKIATHSEGDPDVSKESEFGFEILLDPKEVDESETGSAVEEISEAEAWTTEDVVESAGTDTTQDLVGSPDTGSTLESSDFGESQLGSFGTEGSEDEEAWGETTAESALEVSEPKLVHGQHVDITIVTNQRMGAVTVADEQIESGSYLYVLTRTGKVERRVIQLGLEVDDRIEIVEGLDPGEMVVENPNRVSREDEPFITRMDLLRLNVKLLENSKPMDWLKAIGVGFSKQ